MSTTRLDPEDALAGPLYAVAALLIVVPMADFLLSVASPQPASVQWRFAAVGLLSGFTVTPILGVALALVVAAVRKHFAVQRLLAIACLVLAGLLAVVSVGFLLDVLQLRASVPAESRPAFTSAWTRAFTKHVLVALVLAFIGWRAQLMIPARSKAARTVHVISK